MTPQELTEIRTTLNLTKSDLAKMLGITPMLVGKYEKGSVPIPEKIIKSVEELMGAVQETAATAEEMATPIEEVAADENQPVEEKISDFVKNLRLSMNLTQKAFGEILGVSGASVGFYETGRNEPKDVILEKLKELEASLPTGAVNTPEADEEKATPVVEESDIIVSAPADAEVTVRHGGDLGQMGQTCEANKNHSQESHRKELSKTLHPVNDGRIDHT